jgi:rhodanese-related sulfurtransferase/DNA-binding transcriptional ArsR family regulator
MLKVVLDSLTFKLSIESLNAGTCKMRSHVLAKSDEHAVRCGGRTDIDLLNMSTTKRAFKNQLYEQFARIAKALAHQHRIELIDLLAQGERSVEDLAAETDLPIANVSQHLQVLRMAQMVEIRRQGSHKFYRVADGKVFEIWRTIRAFGQERLAEVERVVKSFFGDRELLEPLSAEQLRKRIKDGDVVVLDVRPENEFASGHIEGAISIPIRDLKRRLKELPRKREIVAYCRGPYCVYAHEAVAELTARGFKARRLEIGVPDWRALGLPVTTTAQTL